MRTNFLPLSRPDMGASEIRAVTEVLRSGHLTTGPKVFEFEKAIQEYLGGEVFAVALNSCTAGLFLALAARGIGKGDEVIVPTWTFAATAHVVLWNGAVPVLCDVDKETLNIDVEQAARLINKKTKAILPVHFAGYPCDMERLGALARKHRLALIEDAAHAIGTRYSGKLIGSFGDVAVFSFYATKNLSCGEGGMAVSRDCRLIERIRKLSYFGINKHAFSRYTKKGTWYYEIEELGYKYNMDSIHAAIGLAQLARLNAMIARRRQIAAIYRTHLNENVRCLRDSGPHYHSYHLFPVRIDRKVISRDNLVERLKERNIGTSVHFIPLHRHPFYRKSAGQSKFPVADAAYEEVVSLPMCSAMSDADARYVVENINALTRSRRKHAST